MQRRRPPEDPHEGCVSLEFLNDLVDDLFLHSKAGPESVSAAEQQAGGPAPGAGADAAPKPAAAVAAAADLSGASARQEQADGPREAQGQAGVVGALPGEEARPQAADQGGEGTLQPRFRVHRLRPRPKRGRRSVRSVPGKRRRGPLAERPEGAEEIPFEYQYVPCEGVPLRVGESCALANLQSRPDLNGSRVMVLQPPAGGRVAVRAFDHSIGMTCDIRVREACLFLPRWMRDGLIAGADVGPPEEDAGVWW